MMPGIFRRSGFRRRRGGALVEGALVLTLVIFTLIAIVDVGQVLVLHQGLVERVRSGARYAVVNVWDEQKIRNVVVYGTASPSMKSEPLLKLKPSMVVASRFNENTPEERILVGINNYPFRFFTPMIAGAYTAKPILISMSAESMGATE